jgi:hypothetical protein
MIKRLIPLLALLFFAWPSHAAFTVTSAGTAGVNSGSATFLATSSYNQPVHDCIVVFSSALGSGNVPNTPTDTALDTFTSILSFTGANTFTNQAWIAYNGAGSSVNVVTQTYGSAATVAYATLTTYDVNPGGNCTSTLLDVNASTVDVTVSDGGSFTSNSFSTAAASEAIFTWINDGFAGLQSATAPSGYTSGSLVGQSGGDYISVTAYKILSSTLTGATVSWTSVTLGGPYDMIMLSLKAPAAGGTVRRRGAVIQ